MLLKCKSNSFTQKLVSIFEVIEGQIGLIVVDDTFKYENGMLLIGTLVVDLTKDVKEDVDFFPSKNM